MLSSIFNEQLLYISFKCCDEAASLSQLVVLNGQLLWSRFWISSCWWGLVMLVAAVHLHDISWDCSTFSRIFNYEENDEHQCSVSYSPHFIMLWKCYTVLWEISGNDDFPINSSLLGISQTCWEAWSIQESFKPDPWALGYRLSASDCIIVYGSKINISLSLPIFLSLCLAIFLCFIPSLFLSLIYFPITISDMPDVYSIETKGGN